MLLYKLYSVVTERVLSFAEGDTTLGQIVRRQLYGDSVATQYADIVLSHLARNMRNNFVPVFELDPELGVGKGFGNRSFHFYTFFFRHNISK